MAQVMVNFRMDEDVKKNMEQACREMGLSMTTAFTIFAKKVGKEKRIPFEITAEPSGSAPYRRPGGRPEMGRPQGEERPASARKRLERLCSEIRRSLTALHTAIPSSITGLSMERIRLLCGNELKDKAAGVAGASKSLFSDRNTEMLGSRDFNILDEYMDGLSSIGAELLELEHTLIPTMKSWHGEEDVSFEPYEQRLAAISRRFDGLAAVMHRFLASNACEGGVQGVEARIRKAAAPVETAYVLTALDGLKAMLLRDYGFLDGQTRERLESDYLQTLELTLWELGQAERNGGETDGKAALCLRVINVLSQVISDNRRARQEWNRRSLEAEVAALERLAAMRGDIGDGILSEG